MHRCGASKSSGQHYQQGAAVHPARLAQTISDTLKPLYIRRDELTTEGGCLLWGTPLKGTGDGAAWGECNEGHCEKLPMVAKLGQGP